MKKQKTQSKIIVALTAVVILLVAVSATLTFAYFTASKSANSSDMTFGTLGLGTVTIAADTSCAHAKTSGTIDKLVPGCQLTLGGSSNIAVTGNIAAFVRATVTITAYQKCNENGVPYVAANIAGTDTTGVPGVAGYYIDNGVIKPSDAQHNATLWAKKTTATAVDSNSDEFASVVFTTMGAVSGWIAYVDNGITSYYYPTAVTNSAVTFTDTFTLSPTALGNAWQGAIMQVELNVDVVQAEHLLDNVTSTYTIVAENAGQNQVLVSTVAASPAWGDVDGIIPQQQTP